MSLEVDIRKNMGNFHLDVRFSGRDGVLGLLGASGCGKSVTLKCIAGLMTPDSGHIELNGRILFDSEKKICLPPQRRRVGYLFQHYALFPNMTVEQNIAAGVRSRQRRRDETARLLEVFRLEELRRHFPRQLSGGQQQRTALARILASEPDVLLLDEPFSALDSTLKRGMELELMDWLEQFSGLTVLVSHDRGEVRRLCRDVCVLDGGTSQAVETVERLFAHPTTLAACRLSGCENISRITPNGDGSMEAVDWGITVAPCGHISPGVTHVGIRADRLRVAEGSGAHGVCLRIKRAIPDVGRVTLVLSPPEREDVSIWMELPPERWEKLQSPGELLVEFLTGELLMLTESTGL